MTKNLNSNYFYALPNSQDLPTQKTATNFGYNFLLADLKMQAFKILNNIRALKALQQNLRSIPRVIWAEIDKVRAQIDEAYKTLESINLEIKMYAH